MPRSLCPKISDAVKRYVIEYRHATAVGPHCLRTKLHVRKAAVRPQIEYHAKIKISIINFSSCPTITEFVALN